VPAIAAAVLAGSAAGAVLPPTGNQDAIDFFRAEVVNYSALGGAKMVENGYFFGIPSGPASVRFIWAQPPGPGYQPQTATIYAQLNNGKVASYLAILTGPGLARVRVLMANGKVYLASGTCWNRATAGASPLGTGDRYLLNGGGAHFLPLQVSGGTTATTFTYPWGPHAQAQETDSFTTGTKPTVHVTILVSGAQKMRITKTIQLLAKAPPLPVPAPPAPQVPKPLCAGR